MILLSVCANCFPPGSEGFTFVGLAAPADYGFTGEPQDPTTGMVHLRARWYQPESATFASRDPFAGDPSVPQTLNPYAYAHCACQRKSRPFDAVKPGHAQNNEWRPRRRHGGAG